MTTAKVETIFPPRLFVHNEEFAARLRTVIARVGGPAKAGDIAGVTGEQIGKWRDGKAKPSFFGLANICTYNGVGVYGVWVDDVTLDACDLHELARFGKVPDLDAIQAAA